MKKNKELKILKIIKHHVINNKKEYFIISLIFIVGVFSGVFFINNMQEQPKTDVSNYLNQFINNFKEIKNNQNNVNTDLLKNSITQNLILAISIWFFGTTVIRNTDCFWNCII